MEATFSAGVAKTIKRYDQMVKHHRAVKHAYLRGAKELPQRSVEHGLLRVEVRRCDASINWYDKRARALRRPRRELEKLCGFRTMVVGCGCQQTVLTVGCDQTILCRKCARVHWRKWHRKILLGLEKSVRDERAAWNRQYGSRRGRFPGIYFLTLTVPHTGVLSDDIATLRKGYRALQDHAYKHAWWRSFVSVMEITPGTDGLGHPHLHVAVVSSWIPYGDENALENERSLHAVWRAAVPGALHVHVVAPKSMKDPASQMAGYLAKYATKGIDANAFTGEKAGELLAAMRGRRKVTTSEGFYVEDGRHRCEGCGEHCTIREPPVSWDRGRAVQIRQGLPLPKHELHLQYLMRVHEEWSRARNNKQQEFRWPGSDGTVIATNETSSGIFMTLIETRRNTSTRAHRAMR